MIRILSNRSALIGAMLILPEPALAQKVLLQLKPHVGDTIRMQVTQTVEMTGRTSPAMTTSADVYSRAVPFQWSEGGTLIHAITDSITTGMGSSVAKEVRRLAMPAKPAVLKVTLDGAMEVVDDGNANSEVRHVFAEMPALLPGHQVSIGDQWTKEMLLPAAATAGGAGTLKAVMRLDSLSRSTEMAYISVKGIVSRVGNQTGTFVGTLQIDRALGWITDARTTISMRSRGVRTRVTVWSRAVKAQ
jgi:hypothetical protein